MNPGGHHSVQLIFQSLSSWNKEELTKISSLHYSFGSFWISSCFLWPSFFQIYPHGLWALSVKEIAISTEVSVHILYLL